MTPALIYCQRRDPCAPCRYHQPIPTSDAAVGGLATSSQGTQTVPCYSLLHPAPCATWPPSFLGLVVPMHGVVFAYHVCPERPEQLSQPSGTAG